MKFNIFRLIGFAAFSAALVSCGGSGSGGTGPSQPTELPVRIVRNLQADTANTGRFTFFSLRDSSIVPNSDSATTRWDIAFRATTVIINGGPIRFGRGGAIVLTGTDFNALAELPETGWRVDSSAASLAIPVGSDRAWYNYNQATNVISPIPGVVLGIRTADGRFAKLQILSYYLGAPQNPDGFRDRARVYTFRYVFQPDGSRRVK
ncbi:MAG: HmuY family protein [Chloroherpetonaceae bacterium]|nr:HmuY family protein [Chloroherpetonaceae bacterium]MDW8020541.1 HmuY family protein [Chloroherpetonaceae bacterium]